MSKLEINELEIITNDVELEINIEGGWGFSSGSGGLNGIWYGSANTFPHGGIAGFYNSGGGSFSSPGGSGSMTATSFGYVYGRGTATVSSTGYVRAG